MKNNKNVIYIMTNPAFPQFVKIGYADDVSERLKQLNRSECIPYPFRVYAYYQVTNRISDKSVHQIIDKLNPNLRAAGNYDGRKWKREFYQISAEAAFGILANIAKINGLEENLVLVEPTKIENEAQENAEIVKTRTKRKLPGIDWLIEQGIVHVDDKIYVINHPDKIGRVINGDKVEFDKKQMSYQQFGRLVTGWKAIQTCAWMKIVGNDSTLSELRSQKMKELGM